MNLRNYDIPGENTITAARATLADIMETRSDTQSVPQTGIQKPDVSRKPRSYGR